MSPTAFSLMFGMRGVCCHHHRRNINAGQVAGGRALVALVGVLYTFPKQLAITHIFVCLFLHCKVDEVLANKIPKGFVLICSSHQTQIVCFEKAVLIAILSVTYCRCCNGADMHVHLCFRWRRQTTQGSVCKWPSTITLRYCSSVCSTVHCSHFEVRLYLSQVQVLTTVRYHSPLSLTQVLQSTKSYRGISPLNLTEVLQSTKSQRGITVH